MKLATRAEVRALLLQVSPNSMVSIVGVTEPTMRVKDKTTGAPNPYRGIVLKVNKLNGPACGDYDARVENKLATEIQGERAVAGLSPVSKEELAIEVNNRFRRGTSWHRPIMVNNRPSCLSVNKKTDDQGDAYLRFEPKAAGHPEFLHSNSGTNISKDDLDPYMGAPSDYDNQGLDNPVRFVVYKLENIMEIAIDGERYRIIDNLADLTESVRNRVWQIAEEYLSQTKKMSKLA